MRLYYWSKPKRHSLKNMKFVALMWIVGGCWIVQADDVTVTTKYGSVLGSTLSFPNATGPFKSVRRFLGIPFASPPLGKLRFSAPEPPKDWKPSTYDARHWRNVCIQPHTPSNYIKVFWPEFTKDNYSEDCLYLNVFTPGNSSSSNLPVMVYIHGGGYNWGTPVYRPGDQIALRGVVVVTIQYRLGPFGFLSTGDSAAPGNFGILDQVEALKWVKENIQVFGGDPSKVTIFGLSAGSTSVALQLLSPLSKGLFHRAISESGVDLSPWAIHKTSSAVLQAKSLATTLGCTVRDSQSIVDCLRSKSAKDLTVAGALVYVMNSKVANDIAWSPVVDGHFLLDTPQVLRKEDKFHKVDYMAGFTSHESSNPWLLNTSFITFTGFPSVDAGVSAAAFRKYLETFAQRLTNDKRNAALGSDAMQFQYTPWPDTSNPELLRQALVDVLSDHDFVAPTNAALSAHSRLAPAFMFLFSHVSKLDKRPAWMGAQHGDCSYYIFGMPFWNLPGPFQFDQTDKNVSHFIIETWTNFAKTGKPTPEPVNGVKWNQFNSSNQVYMDIDGDSPKMRKNYRAHGIAFWNWYYPKLMDTKFEEEQPTVNSIAMRFVPQGTLAALVIALLVASY